MAREYGSPNIEELWPGCEKLMIDEESDVFLGELCAIASRILYLPDDAIQRANKIIFETMDELMAGKISQDEAGEKVNYLTLFTKEELDICNTNLVKYGNEVNAVIRKSYKEKTSLTQ